LVSGGVDRLDGWHASGGGEPIAVDDHPRVRAARHDLGIVPNNDIEPDATLVDPADGGHRRDGSPQGSRREVLDVDGGSDGGFPLPEDRDQRSNSRLLDEGYHLGCCKHGDIPRTHSYRGGGVIRGVGNLRCEADVDHGGIVTPPQDPVLA